MWVPAHEGVSPNSYADAAAKAYLRAGEVEDVTTGRGGQGGLGVRVVAGRGGLGLGLPRAGKFRSKFGN